MRIVTRIIGTKPLLMHNIQLANPDNLWARRISDIAKKKKNKTEEDRINMARYEWLGSLYLNDNKIVVPCTNILKCFKDSGKITREGTSIVRALTPEDISVPLVFSGGPRNTKVDELPPEKLWEYEEFRDQTLVGVQRQRVVRTRPIFRSWALSATWELLPDVMDLDVFLEIGKRAGRAEGLGDNRVNGYGRFDFSAEEIREETDGHRAAA